MHEQARFHCATRNSQVVRLQIFGFFWANDKHQRVGHFLVAEVGVRHTNVTSTSCAPFAGQFRFPGVMFYLVFSPTHLPVFYSLAVSSACIPLAEVCVRIARF